MCFTCWFPAADPARYLCHGRVQVVHDHKHDGCSRPRPAGVLLHWVGPARGPAARPVEGRAPGSSGPASSLPGPWPCRRGRPAPASAEGAPTWSSHQQEVLSASPSPPLDRLQPRGGALHSKASVPGGQAEPAALTSSPGRGKSDTCRCGRRAAAPGQTRGPAPPGHPGGSSGGRSSGPAGGALVGGGGEGGRVCGLQAKLCPPGCASAPLKRARAQPRDCPFRTPRPLPCYLLQEAFPDCPLVLCQQPSSSSLCMLTGHQAA